MVLRRPDLDSRRSFPLPASCAPAVGGVLACSPSWAQSDAGARGTMAAMWSHAPDGYLCPFCKGEGLAIEQPIIVLRRYEHVIVKMQRSWRAV
jgi:hypothetical protein